MQLSFSIKQLGKKRPFIQKQVLDIQGEYHQPYSLRVMLRWIVEQQVHQFNESREEKNLLAFLQKDKIDEQAISGKVGFGSISNATTVEPEQAVEAVLQAFEDGIIAIFLNDTQMERLDEEICLNATSHFTFIRLTFLAGSYW